MKFFGVIIISLLLLNFSSCKTTHKTGEEKVVLKVDSLKNGAKKIVLLKNKKLDIVATNGQLSYTITDSDKTNVVQYVYAIDQDQIAYDGGLKEEVLFEIPNTDAEARYADAELQNTKMIFGRYCYCRGNQGLFKITNGKLHYKTSKKETHFELQYKISEVPQEADEIKY